jgi:hypothetical protein
MTELIEGIFKDKWIRSIFSKYTYVYLCIHLVALGNLMSLAVLQARLIISEYDFKAVHIV